MGTYLRPHALDDALAALAAGPLTILSGGTDHYPARVGRPLDEPILDITRLDALRGIDVQDEAVRIGALTTWAAIRDAHLPPWLQALEEAARGVGGAQIQNAATIGGNLCNASPAADGVPPLLVLDATVELASTAGIEIVPLTGFLAGNRATIRRPDQLVSAIRIPKPAAARTGSAFMKLGARRYLVISIVLTAAALEVGTDGRVASARLAIGACSAVAKRLPAAEVALTGVPLEPGLEQRLGPDHLDGLSPIDDVRADAAYRRNAALTLLRRTVAGLGARL